MFLCLQWSVPLVSHPTMHSRHIHTSTQCETWHHNVGKSKHAQLTSSLWCGHWKGREKDAHTCTVIISIGQGIQPLYVLPYRFGFVITYAWFRVSCCQFCVSIRCDIIFQVADSSAPVAVVKTNVRDRWPADNDNLIMQPPTDVW